MVAVLCYTMIMRAEVLRRRIIWCGCSDEIGVEVCKIMGWHSDCTSGHGDSLEGGRRTVYDKTVVGVKGFHFFSLYSFCYIPNHVTTVK
jgi:hypothetical protein